MSIKNHIRNQIKDAIRHYDFEDAISNAMDRIDIEGLITHSLSERIRDVDFEPLVTDMIQEVIDEELDTIDIEDEVLSALQEEFED